MLRICRQVSSAALALLAVLSPVWAQEAPTRDRAVGRRSTSSFDPVPQQTGNAALFVGVNEFVEDESLAALNFAVNDAIAIAHLFVIELKLVPPTRAVLALSGEPRGEAARAQLAALQSAGASVSSAAKARIFLQLQQVTGLPQSEQDLLLVSLSSHGFEEDGVAYVMPADGVRSFLADTAINLTSVEQALTESKAGKRLLLLDACREKPLAGARGGAAAMSAAFRAALAEAAGQAVLASCDVGQVSFEDADLEHGIFTHYLLEGLRGEAKPDAQGLIRIEQVLEYVSGAVEDWSKRHGPQVQQPWFKGPQIAREIPLAVDPGAAAELKARLERLRALALDGKLTVEQFKEAERLLTARFNDEVNRQRAEIYAKLADGKTDPETAKIALGKLLRTRPSQPGTLTVTADGSGDYTTIQQAMDAARAGDTILVKPGVYREAIRFTDGVRLIGTSVSGCRIESVDGQQAMLVAADCQAGLIENLTFDGRHLSHTTYPAVGLRWESRDGGLWIQEVVEGSPAAEAGLPVNARVVSIDEKPVFASSNQARFRILRGVHPRDVTFELDVGGARSRHVVRTRRTEATPPRESQGIVLLDSSLEIRGCVIQGLTGFGTLVLGETSRPKIVENRCRDNERYGIFFGAKSAGVAENNDCEQNGYGGIVVSHTESAPRLVANRCTDNGSYGIRFEAGAGGGAERNVCERNKRHGILVYGAGCAPKIENNQCNANKQHGISFGGGAGGTADNNTCESNSAGGIGVSDANTAPMLNSNTCRGNTKYGIYFGTGAAGTARENACQQNEMNGLRISGKGTAPLLENNHCRANEKSGICYSEGGSGRAEGNTCAENKLNGIAVYSKDAAPTLKNNRCENNVEYGIMFRDGAGGVAEGNTCTANAKSGIRVRDAGTAPRVVRNQVQQNTEFGIALAYGAGGLLEENTCTGNKKSGINVSHAGTSPTVRKNICRENEHCGIRFGEDGEGVAEGNTCERNRLSGIGIYGKATKVRVAGNHCNNNESYGIYVASGARPRIAGDNTAKGNRRGPRNKQ